ncbi:MULTISPECIES: sugar ABC transporter substrate-binding protein [Pelosinus]|uniref:Periplasmic binding protein/LacI transcriptional regulator n=1 Tax=Pelosinus fermentans B4 TaxID=1149862 RepID=I9B5U2_9FIRM|nr:MULTISPECIES: sugar ABC transporter substrate-binding protein [Pelosinus]EIW20492.1 periplasmic binding protein/LacI transcriptional regulator [Pelosinus fermentans B4]EIW25793.1 periplasmic binding protein/LacI transcriptional regulator [Pelosinus fermentans A11]
MKKNMSLLAALFLMVALIVTGCGSTQTQTQKEPEKIKIGVVVKALNSDFWKTVEAGAKAAGEKYGVEVKVLGPNTETDVTGQISLIEDQVTRKVSALVVAPSQAASTIPVFNRAKEAKIPVILADTDVAWDDKVSFVGTGNFNAGKLAGEYFGKKLPKGSKIVILRGALGDPTHDERVNGCIEGLKSVGLEVAVTQPANSERAMAVTVIENILQSKQEFAGVFTTNDEMGLGAAKALEDAGKKMIVVGFDGSPDSLAAISAGKLDAFVAQNPYNIGFKSVEAAVKVVKGEAIEKRIDTGTEIVNAENVNEKVKK